MASIQNPGDGYRKGRAYLNGSDSSTSTQTESKRLEVNGIYTISNLMKNRRVKDEEIMDEIRFLANENISIFAKTIRLTPDDQALTLTQIAKQVGRADLSRRIAELEQFMHSEAREKARALAN